MEYIDGLVQQNVAPMLTHWSNVFLAPIDRYNNIWIAVNNEFLVRRRVIRQLFENWIN